MTDDTPTPLERARKLSSEGLTYMQVAGRFNMDRVPKDGEAHTWTRTEIEAMLTGAAAAQPMTNAGIRSEQAKAKTPRTKAPSAAASTPTVVLDDETRRAVQLAAASAERASNAATSAARTFRGFFIVLIAYMLLTGLAGVIIGVAVLKEEDALSDDKAQQLEDCIAEETFDETTCENIYS